MKYREGLQAMQNNIEAIRDIAGNMRDNVPPLHKEYFNRLRLILMQAADVCVELDNKLSDGLAKMEM